MGKQNSLQNSFRVLHVLTCVWKSMSPLAELEHKAYWAVKFLNFDEKLAGKKRLLKVDELEDM